MVACVDLSVYLHYHLSPKFSAVQKGKRTLCLRSLRESWAAKVAEHADTERELAAVKEGSASDAHCTSRGGEGSRRRRRVGLRLVVRGVSALRLAAKTLQNSNSCNT